MNFRGGEMTKINQDYTIQIPVKLTDETIDDILWTAFNQGTGYWVKDVDIDIKGNDSNTIYGHIQNGGRLKITYYDGDDMTDEAVEYLTLQDILRGITQYAKEFPNCIEDGEIYGGMIDASGSDLIIQYSIFNGEQIYG